MWCPIFFSFLLLLSISGCGDLVPADSADQPSNGPWTKYKEGSGTLAEPQATVSTVETKFEQYIDTAPSPQDIAKLAFGSTVLVSVMDSNGTPFSLGSGFFVAPDLVATNYHVLAGGSHGVVKLVGNDQTYSFNAVAAYSSEKDVAVLRVSADGAIPLSFSSEPLQVGEAVYAVGNPQGLEGTFSAGIVSGLRTEGAIELIQITAPISRGSSGGPVLDSKGRVVGIATSTLTEGQNLNFAVPVGVVTNLINSSGSEKPISELVESKALSGIGSSAIFGDAFVWSQPNAGGSFSLSLRNDSTDWIDRVAGCVIIFGESKRPVDTACFMHTGEIMPGAAARVNGQFARDTVVLTTKSTCNARDSQVCMQRVPFTKVEIRVLSYQVSN